MITSERASFIAHQWINALNQKDLETVLRNYDNTIRYITPMASYLTKNKGCTIVGKKRLREYFGQGMKYSRQTYYQIQDITVGVDSLSIVYKTGDGKIAVEVMFINQKGKVYKSYAYRN